MRPAEKQGSTPVWRPFKESSEPQVERNEIPICKAVFNKVRSPRKQEPQSAEGEPGSQISAFVIQRKAASERIHQNLM